MLTSQDYDSGQWIQTAFRIMSANYTTGHADSECLPPGVFLDWFLSEHQLQESAALRILNHRTEEGRSIWRIVVPDAFEQLVITPYVENPSE
jgi:hypothetical protein